MSSAIPSNVRTFIFVTKRWGVTDAEFAEYWQRIRPHRAGTLAPPMHLAQSLLLPEKMDESPRLFDAVIEAWGGPASATDVQHAFADFGAVYDRAARFVDMRKLLTLSAEEHVVMSPKHLQQAKLLRALWVVRRKADMSIEAFHDYWRSTHGPMVPRTPLLVRYVQYHAEPRLQIGGPGQYDGVAELCWNDVKEFRESFASDQMTKEQFPDMLKFLDLTRITGGFYRETWRSDS